MSPPKPNGKGKTRVPCYLSARERQILEELARRDGRTLSNYLARLVVQAGINAGLVPPNKR